MPEEKDYFKEYMAEASGTPEPIVKGVLLYFQTELSEAQIDELMSEISQQDQYSLNRTKKILDKHALNEETNKLILQLLNKKFKEAIEKKVLTTRKLDFIRSVKKKH